MNKDKVLQQVITDYKNAITHYSEAIEIYNNALASKLLDEYQARELTSKRDMYIMLRHEAEKSLNKLQGN